MLTVVWLFGSASWATAQVDVAAQQEDDDLDIFESLERGELIDLLRQTRRELEELQGKTEKSNRDVREAFLFDTYRLLRNNAISPPYLTNRQALDIQTRERLIDSYKTVKSVYDAIKADSYWIGVQCEPVEEFEVVLNESNLVKVKGGLVVNVVTKDGPSERAGLKEGDIIYYFAGKPTNAIVDLVAAIAENKDEEASLSVVREQKMMDISLTPAIRAKEEEQEYNQRPADANAAYFQLVMNAIEYPETELLTDGFSIEAVTQKSDGGIDITFRKGDESWTISQETVGELPESIQPFAQRAIKALAPDEHRMNLWTVQTPEGLQSKWNMSALNAAQSNQGSLSQWYFDEKATDNKITEKLDHIQSQLDELRSALKEIKKD